MQPAQQSARTDIIGHPQCACGVTMRLVSIEPTDWPGTDLRNFECLRCFNTNRIWVEFSAQPRSEQEAAQPAGEPPPRG